MPTIIRNGITYGGGGTSLDNYSTKEQVVGTWIDGKNLYRKYIKLENLVSTGVSTFTFADLGMQNVEEVIKYEAYEKRTTGSLVKLNYYNPTVASGTDLSFLLINSSGIYYYKSNSTTAYVNVFIEYTKTTD